MSHENSLGEISAKFWRESISKWTIENKSLNEYSNRNYVWMVLSPATPKI